MTSIKSISGITGTIGGIVNDNLTPINAIKFAAAYGIQLKQQNIKKKISLIIGRDAKICEDTISTEPIIRIYTESISEDEADELAIKFINEIKKCI